MNVDRLKDLSNYLLDGSPSFEDLVKYLFLETFNSINPQAIYFSQLGSSSDVKIVSGFGNINANYLDLPAFSLITKNPFCDSIRTQTFQRGKLLGVSDNSGIDLEVLRADIKTQSLQKPWTHFISVPLGRKGSLVTFLHESPKGTVEEEKYFLYVGILLAIYFQSQVESLNSTKYSATSPQHGRGLNSLSVRQIKILKLVRAGATNQQVSKEIGYSESLVRQELVRIFRILGTSSRVELREFNFPGLDSDASSSLDQSEDFSSQGQKRA